MRLDRRGLIHMAEKRWESEADIHARIRELTGEIRQLRQELRNGTTPIAGAKKAEAADAPRPRKASKKR